MIHNDENINSASSSLQSAKKSKNLGLGGLSASTRKGQGFGGGPPPKTPSHSSFNSKNQTTTRRKALGDISNRKAASSNREANISFKNSSSNISKLVVGSKSGNNIKTTLSSKSKTSKDKRTNKQSRRNTDSSSSNINLRKQVTFETNPTISRDYNHREIKSSRKSNTEQVTRKQQSRELKGMRASDIQDVELRRHADPSPWKAWFEDDDASDISFDNTATMKETLRKIEKNTRETRRKEQDRKFKNEQKRFQLCVDGMDALAVKEAAQAEELMDSRHLESLDDDYMDLICLSDNEFDTKFDLDISF